MADATIDTTTATPKPATKTTTPDTCNCENGYCQNCGAFVEA